MVPITQTNLERFDMLLSAVSLGCCAAEFRNPEETDELKYEV
jgi:hypothetical protein